MKVLIAELRIYQDDETGRLEFDGVRAFADAVHALAERLRQARRRGMLGWLDGRERPN